MYDKANWPGVRQEIQQELATEHRFAIISTMTELGAAANALEQLVNQILERRVRRARPSPFAKIWWTEELTALRDSLSAAGNHLTTIMRRGDNIEVAAARVKLVKRLYTDEIDRRKRQHRSDFLDDRDNVWKACHYAKAGNGSLTCHH